MTDQPRPMWACSNCGGEYVTPLAAALCCEDDYIERGRE